MNIIKLIFYGGLIALGYMLGYSNLIRVQNTQLPFDQEELYNVLVAHKIQVHEYEVDNGADISSKTVTYVRAMNSMHAVLESKGIEGPGAYYIYQKDDQGWHRIEGGQDCQTKEYLEEKGIPIAWFEGLCIDY